jgi:L-lactate dehydrogenase complex protein LldG
VARARGKAIVVSTARTAILRRIDSALRTARIPGGDDHAAQAVSHDGVADRRPVPERFEELCDRFAAEARALGVEVFVEASPEAVRDRLAAMISGRRVLSWNPDQLPYAAGTLVTGAAFGSSPRSDQAAAEVGVTGCHGAVAETGSLALLSRPGCSRTVSLLPALHVALVQPGDLIFGMGDFFALQADRIASASNLTFVTGPSRTADIELSLTIGVHGPARVVVIIGPE